MFIYFCGSIRGGRQDAELYATLIEKLQSYGTVLTEHVGNEDAIANELKEQSEKDIHDRDLKWLDQSDFVVAEVTQPSLGVGYELGRAITMNKKVLCLYRLQAEKKLSAMIRGAENGDSFVVRDYKVAEIDDIFTEFLGSKDQKNGNDAEPEKEEDEEEDVGDDVVDDVDEGEGEEEEEGGDQ